MEWTGTPRVGAKGLVCAVVLTVAASAALAQHVGEDLLLDQQAVASTNHLLTALQQYERTPATQRAVLAEQLAQLAGQRRERMLALIDRNPRLAALRVLPQSVRTRLPAKAQAIVEQPVMINGSVSGAVGDDFEHGRSQTHLEMADAAGQRFRLRVAQASDREQLGWIGKRGAVAAMRFDRHLLVVDKRDVQLLAADGTTSTATVTDTSTGTIQGVQKTLVVMLNFNDSPIACTATDLQNRLFGSTGATLDQGYRQSSGGLVSFTGQVIGPYTVNYSSTGSCDYNGWAAAANALAQSAGFSPSAYNRISYVTPRNANCPWQGLGAVGGSQPTQTWVQQCASTGMFSHELGHNLGFHHASTPGSEYGDASDPMGASKLVQSNAANRVMAGWLYGSRSLDVSSGGSYSIGALESDPSSGPQVLRLKKADTGEYYYLSMRQPVGVDSTNLWTAYQNTVSVHKASGTLPAYTYLLASLGAGQSWSDTVNGITVTSQGVSGSNASVSVALGGATCTRQAPTLGVSPASQSAAPGSTLAYTLSVTNSNSAACPSSTFNLGQTVPSGFTSSLGASSVTLAAGGSTSVGWNVASSSISTDAVYALDASVSESTVTNNASVRASYTVVSPTAPPPPTPPPTPTPSADTVPPIVSIANLSAGSAVTGRSITVTAQASDNVAVASVSFYVDGNLIGTDTSAPYSAKWNTRKAATGVHSVRVRAIDTSGNAAEQTISITLN